MTFQPSPSAHEARIRALLAKRGPQGLPQPAYGGASIANIPVSVVRSQRADQRDGPRLLPPLQPDLDPLRGRRAEGTVVVGLIDGFGWFPFARWARGPSAAGRKWGLLASPITTVFPTTTTSALTSLSSGCAPATHGLVGYRQYLPRFGVVADLLRMSPVSTEGAGLLVGPRWHPRLVSGAPTIFRRGVAGTALSRRQFGGTGFTRILYDGARYEGYSTASELAAALVHLLHRPRPPPVLYTYWDELDTVQHVLGPSDELFRLELDRLAHLFEYVAAHSTAVVRRRTTLLLTGDHGQVPATRAARVAIDRLPRVVREMARPLAGDRRAGLFAAKPGRLEALDRALRHVLPRGARILPVPEVVDAGLFGPPPHHPELLDRLGDLLVLVPSPAGLTDQAPGREPPDRYLFGAHGGLDPQELLVPLVRGSLGEVGGAADGFPSRKR